MSTEHRNHIYRAENFRVSGKLPEAMQLVQDALIDPATISTLPENLLSDHIRKWRIWTVAGLSLAQRQWLAKDARDSLLTIKPIFTTYYHHPEVERRAPNYLKDNEGHPYDHQAEMLRDEGKYWLVTSHIFGDAKFLEEAIRTFEIAISQATLDSPKGIAMIELGQTLSLRRGLNRHQKESIYQSFVHQGFELALPAILESQDQDRLAWLLNTVMGEAGFNRTNPMAAADAASTWTKYKELFNQGLAEAMWDRHQRRMLSLHTHVLVWRMTKLAVNFSQISF